MLGRAAKTKRSYGTLSQDYCSFRLVLLGRTSVGKSSLLSRFVSDKFIENPQTTIGPVFVTRRVKVDGASVNLEIWDTAGEERYESLAPLYYRKAHAAIIVYDITDPDTFQRAKMWVKELKEHAHPNVVIALTGNKADLASKRMVNYEEAEAYAKENSLLLMDTSAKTAMNVKEIFHAIAETLPTRQPKQERDDIKPGWKIDSSEHSSAGSRDRECRC